MTTDKTADQLRACPFCGASASIRRDYDSATYRVRCDNENCACEGPEFMSATTVTDRWNTRDDSGEPVAFGVYCQDMGGTDHFSLGPAIPPWAQRNVTILYTHPLATSAEVERDAAITALRFGARIVELYDDATMRDDHMIDSGDCADILNALADRPEIIDASLAKRGEAGDAERLDFVAQQSYSMRKRGDGRCNAFLWDENFPIEGAGVEANMRSCIDAVMAARGEK